MKVALVHDDLIQFGGAENVLMALHEMFPGAPIYTSLASRKWRKICEEKSIDLRISFMQYLPFGERLNRYYAPFLLHILAFENFDFSEYDLVISSSTRFAHGIITKPSTKHICYMNSPGRMLWEPEQYFEGEDYGVLKPLKFLAKSFLSFPLSHLRNWDYTTAQRVDYFIANSKRAKDRIKKYYSKDSKVIYPFIEYKEFAGSEPVMGDYFVVLTRLVHWKKVNIAVEACTRLGLSLKVLGEGPALESLKKVAGSNVEFLGRVSERKKLSILLGAKALINTQDEDFGIVPLEAMACGKPVVAYGKGGVLETVVLGKTGEFFYEQSAEGLENVLKAFESGRYNPEDCREQAKRFDKENFTQNLRGYISKVL